MHFFSQIWPQQIICTFLPHFTFTLPVIQHHWRLTRRGLLFDTDPLNCHRFRTNNVTLYLKNPQFPLRDSELWAVFVSGEDWCCHWDGLTWSQITGTVETHADTSSLSAFIRSPSAQSLIADCVKNRMLLKSSSVPSVVSQSQVQGQEKCVKDESYFVVCLFFSPWRKLKSRTQEKKGIFLGSGGLSESYNSARNDT